MKPKLFLPALLFSIFFFSCNDKRKVESANGTSINNLEKREPDGENTNEQKQKIPINNLQASTADSASPAPLQAATHIDWDKKIIKTATVKLEVKDFKKFNETVHKTIKQYGGFIAQDQQNFTDEKLENILSVKVPVEQFEGMVNELSGMDAKVIERNITSQDVTGEVVDTKSRLEAKRQVRLKYLEFLKASKNIDEVLKVQAEINSIQEEMEAASGRIDYLSHESSYSTIALVFYQPTTGFKPVETNPSFLTRMANAFKEGASWIVEFILALVAIWPLFLIGTGAFFIYKKLRYSRIKAQKL